jgi:hypothetical protein
MKKVCFLSVLISSVLSMAVIASVALAAYSSHQNDKDVNNFLAVYPFAKGTKLDDCSLCHPGGAITEGTKTTTYGSCDYCHLTYKLSTPHGPVPLNGYGKDYMAYNNGERSEAAIRDIEGSNSDGDSHNNLAEIKALSFPGDSTDYPGLLPAPTVVMNMERILELPYRSEFLLNNTTKSGDYYARYGGVKISDLLGHVRVHPKATQIIVFSPDGFSKTFPINVKDPQTSGIQYDVWGPYPRGYYYAELDFVEYPPYEPNHLINGKINEELYMLLGYLRDGDPLTKGRLIPDPQNPARLVLDGEGSYRLIVPQKIAGRPDRPSTAPGDPSDPWKYDAAGDHNAGFSVKTVAAIQVDPLPSGTTQPKWTEGGWNLVDKSRVVIYGAINPVEYPVSGKICDSHGIPVGDVKLSFGLISLGQIGETLSDKTGKFRMDLPKGEYVVIPSKAGYEFEPPSIQIQLIETGFQKNFIAHPD